MLGLELIRKNIFEDPFFSDFFRFEECDSELKVDIVDNEKIIPCTPTYLALTRKMWTLRSPMMEYS